MSYYQGDFYQGDHHAKGDPFFGALLPFIPKAFGLAKGLLGKLRGVGHMPGGTLMKTGTSIAGRMGGVIAKHPVLTAAGAAGTIGALGGHHMGMGAGQAGMRGHHLNKHGHLVRNRHMRVTNPKALRRAIRRATGFAKLAMRTIHLVHPRKKGRFGGFKKKRAR